MQNQIIRNENLNVGIYCRLSRDDGNLGVSGSIQNQQETLKEYVIKNGWNIINIYIDDGYSGTNFDRPGFQKMIGDIERKRINCVVTKDLSRFGRNYVKSGYYIEEYFPKNGVRYIAVNDNYDSDFEANNDFGPFKNIINEWYAKDISKKIKFSVHARQKRGESKRVAHVLYGYQQDSNGVRTPDPITSEVVRKIFELYVEYKSPSKVVKYLKENKIVCPAYHQFTKSGYKKHHFIDCDESEKYNWNSTTIRLMIQNREYLGHYITHKQERVSYKLNIIRKIENPYVFENRYEPLVTQALFDEANKVMEAYRDVSRIKETNIFQKLIYCENCGKRLCFHTKPEIKSEHSKTRYYCRNTACSDKAYIPAYLINKIMINEIRNITEYILSKKDEFIKYAIEFNNNTDFQKSIIERNNNDALLEKKKKLEKYIEGAFKAKLEGDITEEMYNNIVSGYKAELKEINNKLNFEPEVNNFTNYEDEALMYIEELEKISDFEILNTDILATFCNSINIKTIREDGNPKEYKVRICYGQLDDCIKGFLSNEK